MFVLVHSHTKLIYYTSNYVATIMLAKAGISQRMYKNQRQVSSPQVDVGHDN